MTPADFAKLVNLCLQFKDELLIYIGQLNNAYVKTNNPDIKHRLYSTLKLLSKRNTLLIPLPNLKRHLHIQFADKNISITVVNSPIEAGILPNKLTNLIRQIETIVGN
jgi:nicotinamide mononucleotide adenylyltransferase